MSCAVLFQLNTPFCYPNGEWPKMFFSNLHLLCFLLKILPVFRWLSSACFLTICYQNIVFKHLIRCVTKSMFRNHIHCIQTWCLFRNILKRSCTSYILFFWYGERSAREMHFFLHIKKMGWDPTTLHMCKQSKNCLGTHVGSCVKVLHVQV